jgi:LMBR1 domain-containing protein 1
MARVWVKIEALVRPFSLLCGVLLLFISLLVCISMLLTAIDKARNSVCKQHCGYILTNINVFNPVNFIFVQAARVFPIDYVLFALLVLLFFSSSVVGLATIGIRFLWVQIFQIRKGHTSPQALLMAAAMLMLIALALNYSLAMIVAPQYATFGPQTFCDRPTGSDEIPADCTDHRDYVKPCSELADNSSAKSVCTPSVVSTILNRITWAFPFVGGVVFWAQFVWLGG